jgi:hypothetical protein
VTYPISVVGEHYHFPDSTTLTLFGHFAVFGLLSLALESLRPLPASPMRDLERQNRADIAALKYDFCSGPSGIPKPFELPAAHFKVY